MVPYFEKNTEPAVLIVNDKQAELDAQTIGLKFEGFNTTGALNAVKALQLLETSNIDVVLIDLMMPDVNGLQCARKMRTKFPHVITMLMSDYLLSPVQLAKADTGIVGFVPKPCCFSKIANFILEKLESPSSHEEALSDSVEYDLDPQAPFDILPVQFTYKYK